jgi:hypothetical protein
MKCWLAVSLLSTVVLGQSAVSTQGANRMEITLERLDSRGWKPIDSRLVLDGDDRIRFKFRANFGGFLYVTNQSTSGTTQMLFPREDTGSANRIEPGKEYVVPATSGSFRVAGPEGYDVVSWLVSPIELGTSDARSRLPVATEAPTSKASEAALPPPTAQHSLKPRCDDSIFRARGDCVDTSAGPRPLDADARSRELVFVREKKSSVISSPVPLKGPVVYEFHLAHK